MFRIVCSACSAQLRAPEEMLGRKGRCPKCKAIITLLVPGDEVSIVTLPEQDHAASKSNSQQNDSPPVAQSNENHPPVEEPPSFSDISRNLSRQKVVPQGVGEAPLIPSRTARFQDDLIAIFGDLGIREADNYLQLLSVKFDAHRQASAERSQRFLTDLSDLYLSTAPPHLEKSLAQLGVVLSNWRAKSKQRMAGYFTLLPNDDPLRCPISLFGVMERGRLETAHTHVLSWLLDPRREHGFKDALLVELLSHLYTPNPVGEILVERCEPEFIIDDGRLDVLVQGTARRPDESAASWSWLLMIEAKIDANEGIQQLKKYDKWARRSSQGREIIRLFLTPDGRTAETANDDWTPMSFLDLACLFRRRCAELSHTPGYHFLRYYIAGVLKDVYRWNLPIGDPEFLDDPYNFLEYLSAVCGTEELTP